MISSSSSSFLLLKKSRLRTLSGKISPATRTRSRQLRTTTQKRTKEQKKKQRRWCRRRRIVFVVFVVVAAASSSFSSSIQKRTSRLSASLSQKRSLLRAGTKRNTYYVCVLVTPFCTRVIRINMWRLDPHFVQKVLLFLWVILVFIFFCSRNKKEKRSTTAAKTHLYFTWNTTLVWNLTHHQHVSVKEKEESCE